ncbi:MAG: dCTP deaminase [Candidatus Sericytochromatia bacterium]|uniref:dCTP deaminase, dUMP-forming n=1 Tax=Candidatus Tanganyikabacteria bacterium TaxID=2961651 RepID=A0A938BK97_9BACT|nr:dCTP deaminase [Candidatus Tanganyikabacteria bacterium]
MILNELELLDRLTHPDPRRRVIITPIVDPREQFGPTSVDIRLGTDFKVVDVANISHLDPTSGQDNAAPVMRSYQVPVDRAFILHPGEFALGASMEFVRVPDDISVRVEGRSSWGRVGLLIHATAGFVDPGFAGSITFELHNVSRVPIALYPGVRIAQLCFFAGTPTRLPYGQKKFTKYSGKTGAYESHIYQDPEYDVIRRLRAEGAASR